MAEYECMKKNKVFRKLIFLLSSVLIITVAASFSICRITGDEGANSSECNPLLLIKGKRPNDTSVYDSFLWSFEANILLNVRLCFNLSSLMITRQTTALIVCSNGFKTRQLFSWQAVSCSHVRNGCPLQENQSTGQRWWETVWHFYSCKEEERGQGGRWFQH